jgi:hypothetical protein
MLTVEQEKSLQLSILDFLMDGATLKSLVGIELAGRAPTNTTYNIIVKFAIKHCKADIKLLKEVVHKLDPMEENIDLVSIREQAKDWQAPPVAQLFAALEFSAGPFVDRDDLRQQLLALSDNNAEPILLVNGELGLGKSYSSQMIAEVASQHADYQVAKLRAEPSSASIWGIEDVATEILRSLSNQNHLPPPSHAVAGDRLASLYADWTAEEVARSGDTLWIILDGFGYPDIPIETSKYIDELITMIGSDQRLQRTRVLLFDFDAGRLDSLTSHYDSLVLHLPEYDELHAYFAALCPDKPAYFWESAAAEALKGVPAPGPAYMPKIQLNVKRVASVLR